MLSLQLNAKHWAFQSYLSIMGKESKNTNLETAYAQDITPRAHINKMREDYPFH